MYDPEPEITLMELQGLSCHGRAILFHTRLLPAEVAAEDQVAETEVAAEAQVADVKCSYVTA